MESAERLMRAEHFFTKYLSNKVRFFMHSQLKNVLTHCTKYHINHDSLKLYSFLDYSTYQLFAIPVTLTPTSISHNIMTTR